VPAAHVGDSEEDPHSVEETIRQMTSGQTAPRQPAPRQFVIRQAAIRRLLGFCFADDDAAAFLGTAAHRVVLQIGTGARARNDRAAAFGLRSVYEHAASKTDGRNSGDQPVHPKLLH
jgi:hypothetical protein